MSVLEPLSAAWRARRVPAPVRTPVSTYRLQLNASFTFADAQAVVPYLGSLGVTDVYCSPFLVARAGSTHGYDIVSHERLNPELGSDEDFARFGDALDAHGMGLVLDFVPNHMGVDPVLNAWWRDVLENGPSSPHAGFFDIDWEPVKRELAGRILLPTLGDQYGLVLERGELQVEMKQGALVLRYGEHELPLNPRQVPRIFRPSVARLVAEHGEDDPDTREFLSILTALQNLPAYTERDPERIRERQREKEVARERLGRLVEVSEHVRRFVEECVARANGEPTVPESFTLLHELLEAQAYRLASWRTAADEINYRRFFDVNGLAGLRMEDARVFEATHRLVLQLVAARRITGLRVDHPDGLFDPAEYFRRLQDAAYAALGGPPLDGAEGALGLVSMARPLYVVAEKILTRGEELRADWAVHGTTGYNFLNDLNGIFVDGAQGPALQRIYRRFTGRSTRFAEVEYDCKKLIMQTSMSSELYMLAHALNIVSEGDWRSRDFTLNSLRKALMEVIACFPVYRTYVSRGGSTRQDRAAVDHAISRARRRNPAMEATILDFLRDVLLPDDPRAATGPRRDADPFAFAMKFQQYSGPVHAKGVEDTAFYRYAVLLSLNEVGGHPESIGTAPAEFHRANAARLASCPFEMLTTSTHDTKRGEDGRARLNVLSELPDRWRRAVAAWMRLNAGQRRRIEGEHAPDRNDEYILYQAALASWPAEPSDAPVPPRAPDEMVERLVAYMTKATKEAKTRTSWITPNESYDAATADFVRRVFTGPTAPRFLASFVPFQRAVARLAVVNSLGQLALKLASPGMPDTYQGCELWDLSLVDPDNRRPVDFEARRRALEDLDPLLARSGDDGGTAADQARANRRAAVRALLDAWPDGRIKLLMTACGLRARRDRPELFWRGDYEPLHFDGAGARHAIGFARRLGGDVLIAVAARYADGIAGGTPFPLGEAAWQDARLLLPDGWRMESITDLLTGDVVPVHATVGRGAIRLADLLQTTPAGWWRGREAGG